MSNSAHILAARSRCYGVVPSTVVRRRGSMGPVQSRTIGRIRPHMSIQGGRKVFEVAMKVLQGGKVQGEQTFLLVRWQAAQPDAEPAGFEATLCRHHREAVWLQHSNLTGCGQFGDSCDLCEGRTLMRA